ncbi:MAG: Gldg family protein [bacterium]|nr:Gldg family protein [bacterium]
MTFDPNKLRHQLLGDSFEDETKEEKEETLKKPAEEKSPTPDTPAPGSPESQDDDNRMVRKTDYFSSSELDKSPKEILWRVPGPPKTSESEAPGQTGKETSHQPELPFQKQQREFSFSDRMQTLKEKSVPEPEPDRLDNTSTSIASAEKTGPGTLKRSLVIGKPEIARISNPVNNYVEPANEKPEEKKTSEPTSDFGHGKPPDEPGYFEPVEPPAGITKPKSEGRSESKPESEFHSVPEADNIEAPDELEKVPADDFAPMRTLLVSREKNRREMTPSEIQRLRKSSVKTELPAKPVEEKIERELPEEKTGKNIRPQAKLENIINPSPLSMLMLYGGGVAILFASIALAMGKTGIGPTALGLIGTLLIGIFGLVNRLWFRITMSSRSIKYGANITTVILSLAGILIFANVLSYRYHYRFDLSSENLHSLSPQTIKVLDDINRAGETISVTAFTPPNDGYRDGIENLMDLYLYHTNKIDFKFADPDVQRDLAESKGIERNPSILFELGDKRSITSDVSEPHFTSALLAVRQMQSKLVSFVTGHGEPNPFTDDNTQSGLSKFKSQLELEGYQVNTLDIPQENGVPPETSLLIIVSPERDFSALEIDSIGTYLDNGGNIMCLLESGRDGGLGDLLSEYGIVPNNDTILDDERNAFGEITSPTLAANTEHPITASLYDTWDLLVLNAGSLSFSPQRLPDVTIESLARSSGTSWSETTESNTFDDGVDTRDSRDIAAIATRKLGTDETAVEEPPLETTNDNQDAIPSIVSSEITGSNSDTTAETADTETETPDQTADVESPAEKDAQVMVVADASFVSNANIDSYYNKDFIMNAVNFLTSRQDLISIRPNMREDRPFDLTRGQQNVIFAISVVLTPLLIAAFGCFVWWKRR